MNIRITKPEFVRHSVTLDDGNITIERLQDGTKRFFLDTGNLPKDKADAYVKSAFERADRALKEIEGNNASQEGKSPQ